MKDKIYEQLAVDPEPPGYSGKIPWIVQQQIAATNGIHFLDTIGKLSEYPIPEIPVDAAGPESLLLDIGCGWGRWVTAAGKKNYIPVGVDLRLAFCETARKVAEDNGKHVYTVVADLQQLPFQSNVFDVVWSFSVIQHTHIKRLQRCLEHINRILKVKGYCFLEFPNKKGLRNRFGPAAGSNNMDFDSWDVRYYSPEEYRNIFSDFFDNFEFRVHSAIGIGVLPGDMKYVKGLKNKAGIGVSRALTHIMSVLGPLKEFADSIYIKSVKNDITGDPPENRVVEFLHAHRMDPGNNLNIVYLLRCPKSGTPLRLSEDRTELISQEAGLAYPVHHDTPVMVASEARSL